MKKLFTAALILGALFVSCTKEYEAVEIKPPRDYLPKPTRTEVADTEDGLMVLGPQLNNPYKLATMQQARVQLLAEDSSLDIPELTTSHYYVRFAPQNEDELYSLLQDTTVYFYDFPLDREVLSGTYYHDPAIVDSLPTYQYASISKAKWDADYANTSIAYTILENLFIPEESDLFAGNDDDDGDNGGGDWVVPPIGGGTIIPWIPRDSTGFIPAPDPTDPPIEIPQNSVNGDVVSPTSTGVAGIITRLVNKAYVVAGLESADSQIQLSESWVPAGQITAYDDIVGGAVPIVGAKVMARRWFTTAIGYTDANGNFTCGGSFERAANYCIKWESERWDIREGWLGQAYFNGPKQKSNWNLCIDGGKSLAYATIHRAAYRIYYGNTNNLMRPGHTRKEKISYINNQSWPHSAYGDYYNYQAGAGIVSDIRIYGKDENDEWRSVSQIFSTTSHELGHVIHCVYTPSRYRDASTRYLEAWARCFQYYITILEYDELGCLNNLEVASDYKYIITPDQQYNFQAWHKAYSNPNYPVIFIDVIDNYNQSEYSDSLYGTFPDDEVWFSNIKSWESIVLNSSSFDEVREKLLLKANNLTIGMNTDDINKLFDYYVY